MRNELYQRANISIHTPLAGSDSVSFLTLSCNEIFQSTLPLRGATYHGDTGFHRFYISIHTPLAGSDRRNETFLTK